MWTLRRMSKISWKWKISYERVLQIAKMKTKIIRIAEGRKLRYFGHFRRPESLQKD